jgi:hypothetical protein
MVSVDEQVVMVPFSVDERCVVLHFLLAVQGS